MTDFQSYLDAVTQDAHSTGGLTPAEVKSVNTARAELGEAAYRSMVMVNRNNNSVNIQWNSAALNYENESVQLEAFVNPSSAHQTEAELAQIEEDLSENQHTSISPYQRNSTPP